MLSSFTYSGNKVRISVLTSLMQHSTGNCSQCNQGGPDIYNLAADFLKTKSEETLVFEDSLYALKTAKEAGFVTVGVFDEKGESNQAELENQADLYLKKLDDFIVMSEKILN